MVAAFDLDVVADFYLVFSTVIPECSYNYAVAAIRQPIVDP